MLNVTFADVVPPNHGFQATRQMRRAPEAGRYVAGLSDGWWLTPSGNGGPLVASAAIHAGRLNGTDAPA